MNIEKIKEVFSQEAFVRSLFELDSAAEVQQALNSKGITLSEEEILSIRTLCTRVERGEISREELENGEISEETLEGIAGGSAVVIAIGVVALCAGAVGVGGTLAVHTGLIESSFRW